MDLRGFRRAIIFSLFPALEKTSKDTDYRCCQAVNKFMMKNIQTNLFAGIVAAILFCTGLPTVSFAKKDAFPLYPSIRINVGFWKKVYSKYSVVMSRNERKRILDRMKFREMGLRKELLQAITELDYNRPTPIQMKAIPKALEGRDLICSAQTGTGKARPRPGKWGMAQAASCCRRRERGG